MTENNLPPFYVGQKIVALVTHPDGFYTEGSVYTVRAIQKGVCACHQEDWEVAIGVLIYGQGLECVTCLEVVGKTGEMLFEDCADFAPIETTFQPISLTKVLEEETALIGVN